MSHRFYRVGIVGFGSRGQGLCSTIAQTLPEFAEVIAVADIRTDLTIPDAIALRCRNLRLYGDYREMLTDPQIDAVLITTYEDTHLTISIDAIEAGKAVYCDKPVVQTLEQAERLYEFVTGRECFFQIGLNLPFGLVPMRLKELLDGNAVGRVACVRATCDVGAAFARDVILNKFTIPRGDFILAKLTHDTDLMQYLLNTYAETVWGKADNFRWHRNGEAPTTNDTVVIAGQLNNGTLFVQTLTSTGCLYERQIHVFGTEGEIFAKLHSDEITVRRVDAPVETLKVPLLSTAGHSGADTRILRDFFGYLVQGVREPRWPERILTSVMIPLASLEDGVVNTGDWYRRVVTRAE